MTEQNDSQRTTRRSLLLMGAVAAVSTTAGCSVEVGEYQFEAGQTTDDEESDEVIEDSDDDDDDAVADPDEDDVGDDEDEIVDEDDADDEDGTDDVDEDDPDDGVDEKPTVRFDYGEQEGTLGHLRRAAEQDQELTGETNLEPDATVDITLHESQTDPAIQTVETTVDAEGHFVATLDLSDIDVGSHFVISEYDGMATGGHGELIVYERHMPVDPDGGKPDAGFHLTTEDEVDDWQLSRPAQPDQRLVGDSNLDEGEVMTVVIREDQTGPEIDSVEATVDELGRFVATFDFSDLDAGSYFVVPMHDGAHTGGHIDLLIESA